jgi:DNA-binding CsgD family transcriptional regulator
VHKALSLPLQRVTDRRTALFVRVFSANVILIVGGAVFLALTPLTVGWPLAPLKEVELATWALILVLLDYLVLRSLVLRRHSVRPETEQGSRLTAREIEIIRLIAEGCTSKEIAEILFISPKTVDAHRGHILKKLGMRDRVALTRYAIKRGLVQP